MNETLQPMHSRILIFIFAFLCFSNLWSQYTDLLNSNRPGASQGAFAVGTNVLQFEAGASLGKEKHNLLETKTSGLNLDYSIRYGFWKERLEINYMGSFQSDKITDNQTVHPTRYKTANFKSNTLGVKYLFYDPYRKRELKGPNLYSWRANNKFQWEDLIPAIAFYAGANFDFDDNPYVPEGEASVSPKFVLATQNNWVGGWVFVTNIVVDRITTDFPSYSYILTLTYATNDYFSVFLENQGIKSDFYADQLLRGGAAALLNPDLQVDLSFTFNFKDTPSLYYGRLGVAYRFDMHNRDEYLEDKQIRESRREKKRKEKRKQPDLEEGL